MIRDDIKSLLSYCQETGVFRWRVKRSNVIPAGSLAGGICNGYRRICVKAKTYTAGRLAWYFVHGEWPHGVIDHINGNPDDNRIANLRSVSQKVNTQNKHRARSDSRSQLMGAHPHSGNWVATIHVDGKSKYLGYFKTAEAAHAAYVNAKRELHEGCTI